MRWLAEPSKSPQMRATHCGTYCDTNLLESQKKYNRNNDMVPIVIPPTVPSYFKQTIEFVVKLAISALAGDSVAALWAVSCLPCSQVYWATWETADISSCGLGAANMYRPPSGTSVKLQRTMPCRSSRN